MAESRDLVTHVPILVDDRLPEEGQWILVGFLRANYTAGAIIGRWNVSDNPARDPRGVYVLDLDGNLVSIGRAKWWMPLRSGTAAELTALANPMRQVAEAELAEWAAREKAAEK